MEPLDLVEVAKARLADAAVPVTPADAIFADAAGAVHVDATPANLTNAVVAGRFVLSRHLDGGQFGRGWAATVVGEPAVSRQAQLGLFIFGEWERASLCCLGRGHGDCGAGR